MQEKICLELRQEKYLPFRLKDEILAAAKEYLADPAEADRKVEDAPLFEEANSSVSKPV